MSIHIYASIVTPYGTAANNRGETDGNTTTLQKLVWQGQVHTTVSAEAIRFALRRLLLDQSKPDAINRKWNEDARANEWIDPTFSGWAPASTSPRYLDDDLLGYMSAEAAKEEAEDTEADTDSGADSDSAELTLESEDPKAKKAAKTKKPKAKGIALVRRSPLEIARAISLTPWPGDTTFNAASPGATPSAAKKGVNPVPYGTELHATRYQYGIALTPQRLRDRSLAATALTLLASLRQVAGNHGRFLYDFSPDSIIIRITDDPAPRLLYTFHTPDHGRTIEAPDLLRHLRSGDIDAKELHVGGSIANTTTGKELAKLGVNVHEGVRVTVKTAAEAAQKVVAAIPPSANR